LVPYNKVLRLKQKGTSFGRDQFEFRKRLIIAATIHLAVAVAARCFYGFLAGTVG
jgi:hypothetical protein